MKIINLPCKGTHRRCIVFSMRKFKLTANTITTLPSAQTRSAFQLLLAASALGLTACTDESLAEDATTESHLSTESAALNVQTTCDLAYVSNNCPSGGCPSIVLEKSVKNFNGTYPDFFVSLGGTSSPDKPYVALARATPRPLGGGSSSTTDGYFTIGISGATSVSNQSQISLLRAEENGFLLASDLRAPVPAFTYQGVTYHNVEVGCVIRIGG